MSIEDILFYVIGLGFFLYTVIKKSVPLLSFTGIYLVLCFIFIYIPGYYLYRGGVLYNYMSKVDNLLFILFLFQICVSNYIANYSWDKKDKLILGIKKRRYAYKVYYILLGFTVLYGISYFLFFYDVLPILKVLNDRDLFAIAVFRSDLTHSYDAGLYPSIFAYYRVFTKDMMFFLLFPLIVSYKLPKWWVKLLILFILFISLLAQIEKSYLLMLIAAIFIYKKQYAPPGFVSILLMTVGLLGLSVWMSYMFMFDDINSAIMYIPYRLMAQAGYTSEQIDIIKNKIPIFLHGFNFGFIGKYLGIQYIDFSRMAWERVHYGLISIGVKSGSSAGTSITSAYILFGYIGLIVYPFVLYFHFKIDSILRKSVMIYGMNGFLESIMHSFYIYYIIFCPLILFGAIFGIFSVPYILQPSILVVFISFICMFSIKLKYH